MSFYGNVTNVNKTQFSFDRIYHNRKEMEDKMSEDSIYLGRYVLVEYDNGYGLDIYTKLYVKQNDDGSEEFYTSENYEDTTRVLWTNKVAENSLPSNPKGANNAVLTDQLIYVIKDTTPDNGKNDPIEVFYKCINDKETAQIGDIAQFELVAKKENPYTTNYNIDLSYYKAGRGYDSTVWQKVYANNSEKYVMIAELNSVVPTFALTADAPTMEPITPHFDIDSTNVYYKLHWQPQWGLRVAAQEDKNSDGVTTHEFVTYDPISGQTTTTVDTNIPAAINFNGPAFDPQMNQPAGTIKKKDNTENYFTILPTGKSGNEYNTHDGTGNVAEYADIQEMRINLPAIGNMMSDAWDIIHGPNRDDDMRETDGQGNRVDSLQGRLNSLAVINSNEIPVKRASDGRIVGTRINGDNNHLEDEIPEILSEELTTSLTTDDAWIYTKIDSNAIDDEHNSGIAIHHTFHATENSESSIDKNDSEITTSNEYKADDILAENLTVDKDKLRLYTPYVDAAGHVVGKNIETVTLPYSYRTYETSGVNATSDADIYTTIVNKANGANTSSAAADKTTTIASETQDTITINPGNKWIQTKFEDDSLTIAHEIHAVDTVAQTTNLNSDNVASTNATDKITIQDTIYDMAGHVIQNRAHTYTLPYGFKTITTNGRSEEVLENESSTPVTNDVVAENTQDSLAINSGNKWIRIDTNASGDSITIRHDVHNTSSTEETTDWTTTEADTIIPTVTYEYDEAGHYVKHHTENYKLPFGYGKIKGDSGSTEATATYDEVTFASDDWLTATVTKDTVTYRHDYPKKVADTTSESNVNDNGDTIILETLERDATGHVTKVNQNTVTLPFGFKTITTNGRGSNNANINTGDDVNTAKIDADNTQDTLAVNSGNKWIRIDTNTDDKKNNSLTITHDIHSIETTAKNESDLDGVGEFTVQDLTFDTAGHVTANQAHTYNLPNAIRNIKIGNNSTVAAGSTPTQTEGQSDEDFNASLRVDATTYNDTLNLNAQNRWITLNRDKNNKTITIGHAAAGGTATNIAGDNTTTSTELKFGGSFTTPWVQYDEMGHISNKGTHSVKLPTPSINKLTTTDASVVTSITMESDTGAIIQTNANVGSLLLTGYTVKDGADSTYVTSTDTINAAFGKVDNRLDKEIADARAAEANVLKSAQDYADEVKKAILTGDATGTLTDAYDTLFEIAEWIDSHGEQATELTTAIATIEDEVKSLGIIDGKVDKALNADKLGSIEAANYALKTDIATSTVNMKSYVDGLIAEKDQEIYTLNSRCNVLDKEVKGLINTVAELKAIIEELKNPVNE